MAQAKKKQPVPLVVWNTKTNDYKRYIGTSMTDHIKADAPMSQSLIEQFRTDPNSLFEDEDEIA